MSARAVEDPWAEWLRHRRHGDDPQCLDHTLEHLAPIRDRVLDNAAIREGDTLLDVGCGDGLVAFGALERLGSAGRVNFSDVSSALLADCRSRAIAEGVAERCRFVEAPADDLPDIATGSVDAVTTRSVLIYVRDKVRAFGEFRRVLRAGGRLSIFEPINRFCFPEPEDQFLGYDVTAVKDLSDEVKAAYERTEPAAGSPLLDFDERDLLRFAEVAGFEEVHLDYEAAVVPQTDHGQSWQALLRSSGNPLEPTLAEAIEAALTTSEAHALEQHLRPLVERGECTSRMAVAYLWAA